MLDTLDHVIIAVRDLDEAIARSERLYGRGASWRGRHPGQGTANALFQLANTYVELLAPEGDGAFADALREHLEAKGEGLFGVAFATDDIANACTRLKAAGIAISDPQSGEGRDEETGAVRRWRNAFLPPSTTRGVLVFLIEHDPESPSLSPAPLTCDASACVAALDHVVLRTADPEAAIAFYGDALGIRLALDKRFEERGVRLMFFRLGGVTFEVASTLGDGADASSDDELWGLAYQVPEVDDARRRLADRSVAVSDVRGGNKPGTVVCSVKDGTLGVPTLLIGPG